MKAERLAWAVTADRLTELQRSGWQVLEAMATGSQWFVLVTCVR